MLKSLNLREVPKIARALNNAPQRILLQKLKTKNLMRGHQVFQKKLGYKCKLKLFRCRFLLIALKGNCFDSGCIFQRRFGTISG